MRVGDDAEELAACELAGRLNHTSHNRSVWIDRSSQVDRCSGDANVPRLARQELGVGGSVEQSVGR
jgi:hypothetical protein